MNCDDDDISKRFLDPERQQRRELCAVLTSLSSERLFSRTGATVTARRSRLKEDHVEMLTYVHDNIKYSF